ncbi:MAG: hypothetical protein ACYDB2_11245 [Acidimicrobiales bacterium]
MDDLREETYEDVADVADVAVTNFAGVGTETRSPHFENNTALETFCPLTTPEYVSATGRGGAVVETFDV